MSCSNAFNDVIFLHSIHHLKILMKLGTYPITIYPFLILGCIFQTIYHMDFKYLPLIFLWYNLFYFTYSFLMIHFYYFSIVITVSGTSSRFSFPSYVLIYCPSIVNHIQKYDTQIQGIYHKYLQCLFYTYNNWLWKLYFSRKVRCCTWSIDWARCYNLRI